MVFKFKFIHQPAPSGWLFPFGGDSIRKSTKAGDLLLCLLFYPLILWAALLIAPCWGGSLMDMIPRLTAAMQTPTKIHWTEQSAPSIFVCTGIYVLGLAVHFSSRRRTRNGEEHGSATWGSAREVNRQFAQKQSKILTRHIRLGLDSRRHRRSLNVLVIGGSGAAKTRSYVLPNILEANANYVITDPKSEVLLATGGYLKSKGYEIRVLNLVNLSKSDGYNPFCYLRDESGLAEPAGFGILPELLRLLPVQAQADFVVLRFGSSFLPPVDGIGVRVLPASGAKDIFARCLRTLAAGERELRRWAQRNWCDIYAIRSPS